jgi:hypothetical protein
MDWTYANFGSAGQMIVLDGAHRSGAKTVEPIDSAYEAIHQ